MKRRTTQTRWTLAVLGLLVLETAPAPAQAQGIPFVTRRTATIEKQVPPRRFFDAAGFPTAGADTNAAASARQAPRLATTPVVPGQPPTGIGSRPGMRPVAPSLNLATRPGTPVRLPPPGPARGYLVPPLPASRVPSPARNEGLPRPVQRP